MGKFFTSVKNWYKKTSNAFKAAVNSAWQAFAGVFGVALLGWVTDVADWAGNVDDAFPSVSPLGKAAVAGLAAGATFIVTYVFRVSLAKRNPQAGPHYGK